MTAETDRKASSGGEARDVGRPTSDVTSIATATAGRPVLGMAEHFPPGDPLHVEVGLRALASLSVHHLRIELAWAGWHENGTQEWYRWLMDALSPRVTVLPALVYLPPSSSAALSIPPEDPKAFADFLETLVDRFAGTFEWIELPSEPAHAGLWDWRLDPRGHIFSQIIASAAYRCRQRGIKTVLGGLPVSDLRWLSLLCENGVVDFADAIGLREDPAAPLGELSWGAPRGQTWADAVREAREILGEHCRNAQLWIAGAGCSTDNYDEFAQCRTFVELLDAGVERVYWSCLQDRPAASGGEARYVELGPGSPIAEVRYWEPHQTRHVAFGNPGSTSDVTRIATAGRSPMAGLLTSDGTPKLLFRLWNSQGLEGVRQCVGWGRPSAENSKFPAEPGPRPVLITGGAGFIGSNLAERLLEAGRPVIILDNLSRAGVEHNVRYLRETYGDLVEVHIGDVRNRDLVTELAGRCGHVFHFAAQVAVTTSLVDPRSDFASNLQGTLNVLEAIRRQDPPPTLLFTSTNKVYGDLRDIELVPVGTRHVPRDHVVRMCGISEAQPLEFHSPYGCSKGAADQYVLDYARMYRLPSVVFRMSCIYGRRQLGTEDQGWVAHFALQMLRDGVLTVYGDGRQVRDILYIDDLLDAMLAAVDHIRETAGKAFNIGGGPDNAVSLLDVIGQLAELSGVEPQIRYGPRRKGDQSYYVSDTRRFAKATGWTPQVGAQRGVARLYHWILENVQPGVLELPSSEEDSLATLQPKE